MQMTFDYGCGETGGEVVVVVGGLGLSQEDVIGIRRLFDLFFSPPSLSLSPFFHILLSLFSFSARLENPPGIKIAPCDGPSNYSSQTRNSALNGGASGRRLPRGRRRIKLMTITEGFVVVSHSLALQL